MPQLTEKQMKELLGRRSRIVLSSGGVQPVVDSAAPTATHSVFARAFIDVLQRNSGSLSIAELYGRVFVEMDEALEKVGLSQEPQLRAIGAARHGWGDFYFVAK